MLEILKRESTYLWYYFSVQLEQILPFWVLGMVVGSFVSVFLKAKIHYAVEALGSKRSGPMGIVIASGLGILSPLCLYGTIPIAASFSASGVEDDWLAAFMMSSVLLNPQLMVYSAALGQTTLIIRLVSCVVCGIAAGFLVRLLPKRGPFFNFEGFEVPVSRDTAPNPLVRFLKNLWRNVKATGLYFLLGVALAAVFQRYVSAEIVSGLFGGNEAWGVLMAATIGVPMYACGGGTIPLLQLWLTEGMSMGSAAAFMLTGPATKITNLGALKIVLPLRKFGLYFVFVIGFAFLTGLVVNCLVGSEYVP